MQFLSICPKAGMETLHARSDPPLRHTGEGRAFISHIQITTPFPDAQKSVSSSTFNSLYFRSSKEHGCHLAPADPRDPCCAWRHPNAKAVSADCVAHTPISKPSDGFVHSSVRPQGAFSLFHTYREGMNENEQQRDVIN